MNNRFSVQERLLEALLLEAVELFLLISQLTLPVVAYPASVLQNVVVGYQVDGVRGDGCLVGLLLVPVR